MRIAIDASSITSRPTGIGYMATGFIRGLSELGTDEVLVYTPSKELLKQLGPQLNSNITVLEQPWLQGLASGMRWYRKITRDMQRRQVDVFISPSTFTASLMFPRTVQIVPDLSPLQHPEMFTFKHQFLFKLTLRLAMRSAWKVATISQSVAEEIKSHFPSYSKPIGVVPLAPDDWATASPGSESEREATIQKYQLPEKYFLSVSTLQPRKNYVRMIRAFAEFRKQHSDYYYLISGAKGWKYQEVFDVINELKLQEYVRVMDYLPDSDLAVLTDLAAGFLYVSLEEGFGIPPLNAACRGVPVLVTNLPVFREILTEDEAIFVDPLNVSDIAKGQTQLLSRHTGGISNRIVSKYTWSSTARELLKLASHIL